MVCTPMPSHFIWEMGHWAMWSRSIGGEAMALGAHESEPLMVAGGTKGSWIPSSPVRRHARSGWCAWWKVERGLDSSLSASSWFYLYHATFIIQPLCSTL